MKCSQKKNYAPHYTTVTAVVLKCFLSRSLRTKSSYHQLDNAGCSEHVISGSSRWWWCLLLFLKKQNFVQKELRVAGGALDPFINTHLSCWLFSPDDGSRALWQASTSMFSSLLQLHVHCTFRLCCLVWGPRLEQEGKLFPFEKSYHFSRTSSVFLYCVIQVFNQTPASVCHGPGPTALRLLRLDRLTILLTRFDLR